MLRDAFPTVHLTSSEGRLGFCCL